MPESLKDVVAIAIAVALVMLVALPVGGGMYGLPADREMAVSVAAEAEATGLER